MPELNHANIPQLILVGGSNGSGKTTLAKRMVEQYGFRYLGADEFAYQLNPHDVESVEGQAARLFIHAINESINNQESIIVESTLAGLILVKHIKRARQNGYKVCCVYIYLDSVEISLQRVKLRVSQGGHNVPEDAVRRRFPRSRINFWNLYRPICHLWELYYNSPEESEMVIDTVAVSSISLEQVETIEIHDRVQFDLFLVSLGEIYVEN